MIRFGLRLTVAGGREALARLALIVVAVAIGVALLLTTLASLHAVSAQNSRYAWLETVPAAARPSASGGTDPLWWRLQGDYFQGKLIGRVDLAATGAHSPALPGISKVPGPGQFYASPALSKLLQQVPDADLRDRFPGTEVGTIGAAALPAPNSLIIVIGHRVADIAQTNDYHEISHVSTTSPSSCSDNCLPGVGIDDNGLTLILAVVAGALLFPVLIFTAGATRLSAARREQRFAAMRLVGATPGQISVISTVESVLAATAGVVFGFALFFALRPVVAPIPFTGDPFFTHDLSVGIRDGLLVALGIPIGAAAAARLALRRVNISPLGVTRRVTPRPPRAWRLLPAFVGIAWLGFLASFSDIGDSHKYASSTQAFAYLAGVFLIMGGLVIAGPWLTMVGSRVMARRAGRPAALIAARRLADNPRAAFRAISGLVLALFVGTCSVGIITTIVTYNGGATDASAALRGTVVEETRGPEPTGPATSVTITNATARRLDAIPGVTGLAVIRTPRQNGTATDSPTSFVSCTQLAGTPALGHCPRGADVVRMTADFGGAFINKSHTSSTTWPDAHITLAQLRELPVDSIAVATDGSTGAIERARTVLGLAYPESFAPQTISEIQSDHSRQTDSYQRLADVVILTSLPIAGCGLAVSIVGGLAERKRPFSLLRLTGTPLATLRHIVALETAVPLLVAAAVSVGAGFLAAALFLHAQLRETLQPPGSVYFLIVLAGLVASLAVIASTLPLLERITGPETARNE